MEPQFAQALATNPPAQQRFERLPPSHQQEYLKWIAEAKKAETKQKRIAQAVQRLLAESV